MTLTYIDSCSSLNNKNNTWNQLQQQKYEKRALLTPTCVYSSTVEPTGRSPPPWTPTWRTENNRYTIWGRWRHHSCRHSWFIQLNPQEQTIPYRTEWPSDQTKHLGTWWNSCFWAQNYDPNFGFMHWSNRFLLKIESHTDFMVLRKHPLKCSQVENQMSKISRFLGVE